MLTSSFGLNFNKFFEDIWLKNVMHDVASFIVNAFFEYGFVLKVIDLQNGIKVCAISFVYRIV